MKRLTITLATILITASTSVICAKETTTTKSGSGKAFNTTVTRNTHGELSDQDLRQASILASHVVRHVGEAALAVADEQTDQAKQHVEKARKLVEVIRELLPVTEVTTVVTNADGEEVYRDTERIQDDRIPIFEQTIAVQVVQAVMDAKQQEAALKGLQLSDADLVHTSVLVDLDFIERRLNHATRHLDSKDEEEVRRAAVDLTLAHTSGVDFVVNKEDHPLWEAQVAIELAERMAREERFEAAQTNLALAQAYLTTYKTLVADKESDKIEKLSGEISDVAKKIEKKDSPDKIRGFWHRITGWFQGESGQAESTEDRDDEQPESSN